MEQIIYKCNDCEYQWETDDPEVMQCPICRSFDIAVVFEDKDDEE